MKLSPDDWQIIRSAPLFAALREDIIPRIVCDNSPYNLQKGATIFRRGDPATMFFIVLEGWVKLSRVNEDGSEVVVEIMGEKDCFAEAAMFLGRRYPVDAASVTDVRLAAIDFNAMRNEIHSDPDVALSMLASLSKRLHGLVDQIDQIKARSAPERVAEFFLSFAKTNEGRVAFSLPFEKTLAAARLGMRPESFSRAVAKLRPFGVSVEHDRVEIENCSELARRVQAHFGAVGSRHDCPLGDI